MSLFFERVWDALLEDGWRSMEEIWMISGVNEPTLNGLLDFLVEWGFVEARSKPRLAVRRRGGAISPMSAAWVLRKFMDGEFFSQPGACAS